MTPDAILTSVVAVVAAVLASTVTAWVVRRGEERSAVGTSARHDAQIAQLGQALSDLRGEVARQGAEVREWMARITSRLDMMDARLTRLEARLDERDRRGAETRAAIVGEAMDGMQEWCETRCEVRKERNAAHATNPRMRIYDPGEVKP